MSNQNFSDAIMNNCLICFTEKDGLGTSNHFNMSNKMYCLFCRDMTLGYQHLYANSVINYSCSKCNKYVVYSSDNYIRQMDFILNEQYYFSVNKLGSYFRLLPYGASSSHVFHCSEILPFTSPEEMLSRFKILVLLS